MKNHSMKKKLMATSLMLVISILMMSTASFAWFTISTAPEVSGLKTDVVVNDNLEIAFATSGEVPIVAVDDTGKQSTWGNVIDIADTDDGIAADSYTLRPMTYRDTDKKFYYPTYGADGRMDDLVAFEESTSVVTKVTNWSDTKGNVYGYYFDMWIRTNNDGDIKLLTDEGTARHEGSTASATEGLGSNFVIAGTGAGTATSTALQMAADNVFVGFRLLGSSALNYTSNASASSYTYNDVTPVLTNGVVKFTKSLASDSTNTAIKYDLSGNLIADADQEPNTAYLVRIYVWLDGANITNAGASLNDVVLGGDVHIQFTVDGTIDSMPLT